MSVRTIVAIVTVVTVLLGGAVVAMVLIGGGGPELADNGTQASGGGGGSGNDGGGNGPALQPNVSATAIADGGVRLTFADVDNDTETYEIRRRTTNTSNSVVATVTDDDSSEYTVTDAETTDGTTYSYTVVPKQGNQALGKSKTVSVIADATAPTVSANGLVSVTEMRDREMRITFQTSERLGDVAVEIGGAETATLGLSAFNRSTSDGTSTYVTNYTGSVDGTYTVNVTRVADHVGNEKRIDVNGSVRVEAERPKISGFNLSNPSLNRVMLRFNSTKELDRIEVRLKNTDKGDTTTFTRGDFTETVSNGTYTYTVRTELKTFGTYRAELQTAVDEVGNSFKGIHADELRYTGSA